MNTGPDPAADRREAMSPLPPGRSRVTIRIDDDILAWFRHQAAAASTGSYQGLMNKALREHMQHQPEPFEATVRRAIREELATYVAARLDAVPAAGLEGERVGPVPE